MDQETQKLVDEQFKKLPENLQKAINLVQWKPLVKEVAKESQLSEDQVETLERETMFIIYGFEKPDDYINNLMRELNIDEDKALDIAEKVNTKVFQKISLEADKEVVTPIKIQKPSIPEVKPDIHPMIEEGERVHDVPHVEQKPPQPAPKPAPAPQPAKVPEPPKKVEPEAKKPLVSTPNYHYPAGKDPYREPIE